MNVKILIEFEVHSKVYTSELTEAQAKSAASAAAYDYLCFTKNLGDTSSLEAVTVFVDGYGECEVRVGKDHE